MTPDPVGTATCEPIKTATPPYLTAEQVGEPLHTCVPPSLASIPY
jgi:hypothetical protein